MGHRQREILCIDDDSQSLKVRGILLESMGYKVLSEPDAERGPNQHHGGAGAATAEIL